MILSSTDNKTKKFLVQIDDNFCAETTYVDYPNKHIVCFSSMIGCPIGCTFCVSGQSQSHHILTVDNMLAQCYRALPDDTDDKPILFSCMGEGEPFLNFRNVVTTLKQLGTMYPNSKLALSTSGAKPYCIPYLAVEKFPVPFKLQISIHSMYDHIRKELMPNAAPLDTISRFLPLYLESDKDIEFNYVLLDGINDQACDAVKLADFAGDIKIKLNMLNPAPNNHFDFSTRFDRFCEVLDNKGANYEFYATNGTDINAACGQLTYKMVTS